MKRFKIKDNRVRKIIIIVLILLILYLYFDVFDSNSFYKYIISDINSKYENTINLNNRIIYNSLDKIVGIESLNHKEVNNVIKIKEKPKKEEKIIIKKPIIYIYNTHDTEKYSIPYVSDYSISPNVKFASYILKDYLNDLGIESTVEKRSISDYLKKNKLNYYGCYEASRAYLKDELSKNDYKIFIDIHRDSAKHKYTLYEYKGKRYAKVMFVLTTKHKSYKQNESFVINLNKRLSKKYNGITRGIMKRSDVIFNQDISPRAILIELGGVDNTLDEINNTLYVLADVLSEYIKEEL